MTNPSVDEIGAACIVLDDLSQHTPSKHVKWALDIALRALRPAREVREVAAAANQNATPGATNPSEGSSPITEPSRPRELLASNLESPDTGHAEADRIIARLASSDPDFDDCTDAVVLIRRLVADLQGPPGYATWKDAAVAERVRRVAAETESTPLCDGEVRVIYEHGEPSGVRDVSGYLCFFNRVTKWPGQEDRYRDELALRSRQAEAIATALRGAQEGKAQNGYGNETKDHT